jgi:hypothetical protein
MGFCMIMLSSSQANKAGKTRELGSTVDFVWPFEGRRWLGLLAAASDMHASFYTVAATSEAQSSGHDATLCQQDSLPCWA